MSLRERAGRPAQLVYSSAPEPGSLEEVMHLIAVSEPEVVLDALLGVAELMGVVAIQRQLYSLEGARVALDSVAGLGQFVTVRVPIGADEDREMARARLARLRGVLRLEPDALLARTYGELAFQRRHGEANERSAIPPSSA